MDGKYHSLGRGDGCNWWASFTICGCEDYLCRDRQLDQWWHEATMAAIGAACDVLGLGARVKRVRQNNDDYVAVYFKRTPDAWATDPADHDPADDNESEWVPPRNVPEAILAAGEAIRERAKAAMVAALDQEEADLAKMLAE